MISLSKVRAVGGSLMITIPSKVVEAEKLTEGELVELEVKKHKQDFFGTMPGIGSFKEDDRFKGQLEK